MILTHAFIIVLQIYCCHAKCTSD